MSTVNISCCMDPIFMLKYCNDDDEAMATRQSIIQQGNVIARWMEEQQPPRPSACVENEIKRNLQMSQLLLLRMEDKWTF